MSDPEFADDDATRGALRRLSDDGNDMTAPMVLDFFLVAPGEDAARKIRADATARGFTVSVDTAESGEIDVNCALSIVASYENVVTLEQILLPVLFGTEDSRDCVGEHVGEMTLLFQPLVGYFSGSCFFRLYDLSCNKTSTKLSPVIVHEVFKSFLDESSLISFHH